MWVLFKWGGVYCVESKYSDINRTFAWDELLKPTPLLSSITALQIFTIFHFAPEMCFSGTVVVAICYWKSLIQLDLLFYIQTRTDNPKLPEENQIAAQLFICSGWCIVFFFICFIFMNACVFRLWIVNQIFIGICEWSLSYNILFRNDEWSADLLLVASVFIFLVCTETGAIL